MTFDQPGGYITGTIEGGNFVSGFDLSGSGDSWSGYIAGDDPSYGMNCLGTPLGTGCAVTGYFQPIAEPSSVMLELTALFGLLSLVAYRKFA